MTGTVVALALAASSLAQTTRTIVIERTLETSLAQPMVHVQLQDGKRPLTARPTMQEQLVGGGNEVVSSIRMYLDTGASAIVISKATAQRFGVEAEKEAVYHEVGLHGPVPMGVSRPYSIALASFVDPAALPKRHEVILSNTRVELNRADPDPMMAMLGASLDVAGMPVIEELVVEIIPGEPPPRDAGNDPFEALERLGALMQPPVVRLHGKRRRPGPPDVIIPLEYMDYNVRHVDNRGPRPALASNPVVPGVTIGHDGQTIEGDWLLDTGAAASIISTAWAKKLGLLTAEGKPAREPDFTLPLGGIGGAVVTHPGFVVERVWLPAASRRRLEYHDVRVIVLDVGIERTPGTMTILDGVLGMNLLLPTASGLTDGMPDETAPSPFAAIWIDGPRRRLVLDLP